MDSVTVAIKFVDCLNFMQIKHLFTSVIAKLLRAMQAQLRNVSQQKRISRQYIH